MSEKKMVRRSVAIALGIICIICIIMVASIASLLVVINSMNGTIQTDNNQINSLNSLIIDQNLTINMEKSELVFNQNLSVQAGQSIDVYDLEAANYSGTIWILMEGLNLGSTWINVAWGLPFSSGQEMSYNETRVWNGILWIHAPSTYADYFDRETFPIVKNGYIHLTLGNNGSKTITESMTVTYYY